MMLVLGLGNPGTKYERTRHNVGTLALESCAAFFQLRLKKRCFRLYRQAVVDGRARLVHPLTYMNRSGEVLKYFEYSSLVVLCDQMDLPAGTIRLRRGGSSAGHRGLMSLIEAHGDGQFIRIYIGIGRPSDGGVSSTTYWGPSMTRRSGMASPWRARRSSPWSRGQALRRWPVSTIVEQVLRILERFFDEEGIDRNQEMAVAFSGGSDSLALLHAVSTLVGAERVHALYVNHHLRSSEELSGEIELNEHNCRLLGVSFTLLDLGHGSVERALKERGRGVEEAARQLRYDILGRTCRERSIPYLLTAHNSDDQLETLLMRVAQASSIASLASIRRRRDLEGVTVLRPVLEVSHSDLALYARTQGLTWSLDSTNDEDTYLRNALRREVKKPLLALFPNARSAAVVLGRRFEETSRLLDLMVEEALGSVICDDGVVSFTLVWYRSLVDELRELLLYRMVALVSGEERIARTIIAELVKGIDELERAGGGVREIGSLRIESREGMITLSPIAVLWSYCLPLDEPMKAQRIALPGDAEVVIREFVEGYWDTDALRIDASSLNDPVIRRRRAVMRLPSLGDDAGGKALLHESGAPPAWISPDSGRPKRGRGGLRQGVRGRDRIAERFKAPLLTRLQIYIVVTEGIGTVKFRNESNEGDKKSPQEDPKQFWQGPPRDGANHRSGHPRIG